MTTATYQQLALAWHPQSKVDKPFTIFAVVVLFLFFALALFIGSIDVPQKSQRTKVAIPDRVAKFILEQPKKTPKPKLIKKPPPKPKVIKKPPVKPKEVASNKIKKQQVKKELVLTKKQMKARQNASESGLLALSNELADLIDTSSIDNMVGTKIIKSDNAAQKVTSDVEQLLIADASKGSGGVSSQKLLTTSKPRVKLDKSQVTISQQLIAARADVSIVEGAVDDDMAKPKNTDYQRTGNYRPEENIAFVMDKNKSKLHALYRKARRSNPSIQGKIVLEITISPQGKVLKVYIASSELNDERLEARIVARIKQFNFGEANVKAVTVTYPVEFLPS